MLVTGGTGFLGQALLHRLLLTERRPLIAAVRSKKGNFPAEIKVELVGELSSNTDWSACLQNVGVVIHCAARTHIMKDETGDPLIEYRRANVQGKSFPTWYESGRGSVFPRRDESERG